MSFVRSVATYQQRRNQARAAASLSAEHTKAVLTSRIRLHYRVSLRVLHRGILQDGIGNLIVGIHRGVHYSRSVCRNLLLLYCFYYCYCYSYMLDIIPTPILLHHSSILNLTVWNFGLGFRVNLIQNGQLRHL